MIRSVRAPSEAVIRGHLCGAEGKWGGGGLLQQMHVTLAQTPACPGSSTLLRLRLPPDLLCAGPVSKRVPCMPQSL